MVIYPLVNVYKKLWKITIFMASINHQWQFSIAILTYQWVSGVTRIHWDAWGFIGMHGKAP